MWNINLANVFSKDMKVLKVQDINNSIKYIMGHYSPLKFGHQKIQSKLIPKSKSLHIRSLLVKRCKHVPIQYIIKKWHFRYLNIRVKPPIFIPRLQTEWMITILRQQIQKIQKKQRNFVDLCCGSGIIGLSLIKELGMSGVMVDINPKAIQLTAKNIQINKIDTRKVKLVNKRIQDFILNSNQKFDIIMSNPPYVQDGVVKNLDKQVRRYESHLALKGGQDGLYYVRFLLSNYHRILKQKGILIIEYGGQVLKDDLENYENCVVKDQYNQRRFIVVRNKFVS